MKLYVIRERWGRYVTSPRPPKEVPITKEPVAKAGVAFNLINWGDWAIKPFAERVIIYNVIATYAIETLGLYGPKAIHFINSMIAKEIAWEASTVLWSWLGAIGVYAGVLFLMAYYSPEQREFIWQELFPWRYLFRYEEKVWAADLCAIDSNGRPYYRICHLIGDIIIGEHRRKPTLAGVLDVWDTGHLWIQRRDRFLYHEGWFWNTVFVDFLGVMTHVAPDVYVLQKGFRDPYASELPVPYEVPAEFICREWDPAYKIP